MRVSKFLSFAMKSVKERRTRAILTILGIAVGPAAIVAINSMVEGYSNTILSEISGFLSPYDIVLTPSGVGPSLTQYVVDQLDAISGVKMSIPFYTIPALANTPQGEIGVSIFSVNLNQLKVAAPALSLMSGKYPPCVDYEAVAGYDFSSDYGFSSGEPVQVTLFYHGINGSRSFLITGILNEFGSFLGVNVDKSIIVPLSFGEQFSSSYSGVIVVASSTSQVNSIVNAIKQEYGSSFNVVVAQEFINLIGKTLVSLNSLLISAGATSFVVSFMGVTTTMFTSVVERTREIGLLRALGFTRHDVLVMFLAEALLMGFIGGIIGIGAGMLMAFLLTSEHFGLGFSFLKGLQVTPVYSPIFLAEAIGIAVTLSILAAMAPSYRASKQEPSTALRHD